MQSEHIKMHLQEIPPIRLIGMESFCVLLCTDYLSDYHKKFKAASPYDTKFALSAVIYAWITLIKEKQTDRFTHTEANC